MSETFEFPCPSLFTEGYGITCPEMDEAIEKMQVEYSLNTMIRQIEHNNRYQDLTERITIGEEPQGLGVGRSSVTNENISPGLPRIEYCSRCQHDRNFIESRGVRGGITDGGDSLNYRETCDSDGRNVLIEPICESCWNEETTDCNTCVDCEYSEILCVQHGGEPFQMDVGEYPTQWRCSGCFERYRRWISETENLTNDEVQCHYCMRVWDGNAQCPCGLHETYINEYEIEESSEEEDDAITEVGGEKNNLEKVKEIMKNTMEISEMMFDIKEEIREEVVYLKIMDNLKKLNDIVKTLE